MRSFGSRLRQQREKQKLSVVEVARKVGVSPSTYREWEYGRLIKGEPYLALSKVLGIGLYELMSGEQSDKSGLLRELDELERRLLEFKRSLVSLL